MKKFNDSGQSPPKIDSWTQVNPVSKRKFLKALILGIAAYLLPGRARALELLENLENAPPTAIEKDLLKNPHKQMLLASQEEFN